MRELIKERENLNDLNKEKIITKIKDIKTNLKKYILIIMKMNHIIIVY